MARLEICAESDGPAIDTFESRDPVASGKSKLLLNIPMSELEEAMTCDVIANGDVDVVGISFVQESATLPGVEDLVL